MIVVPISSVVDYTGPLPYSKEQALKALREVRSPVWLRSPTPPPFDTHPDNHYMLGAVNQFYFRLRKAAGHTTVLAHINYNPRQEFHP